MATFPPLQDAGRRLFGRGNGDPSGLPRADDGSLAQQVLEWGYAMLFPPFWASSSTGEPWSLDPVAARLSSSFAGGRQQPFAG